MAAAATLGWISTISQHGDAFTRRWHLTLSGHVALTHGRKL